MKGGKEKCVPLLKSHQRRNQRSEGRSRRLVVRDNIVQRTYIGDECSRLEAPHHTAVERKWGQ